MTLLRPAVGPNLEGPVGERVIGTNETGAGIRERTSLRIAVVGDAYLQGVGGGTGRQRNAAPVCLPEPVSECRGGDRRGAIQSGPGLKNATVTSYEHAFSTGNAERTSLGEY